MRSSLFILFSIAMLVSCTPKDMLSKSDPWIAILEKHEASQLAAHQMKLIAGGPPRQGDANRITLHYVAFNQLEIPGVRKLIIDAVQDFLEMINHNPSIVPLLDKHPLTANDISFNVGFGKTEGGFQEPPYVAYAYLVDGMITYCYLDNLFGRFIEEEDMEEPYKMALKQILEERSEP